ncbi:MAG: M55 family metallopeptidase [Phycisphaerales bacterium]|nr:M55 family metallopeptidase [Phycisphaerales bacterium]
MKIYVAVDAEGISGIMHTTQVMPDGPCYSSEGRRYITEEVNACVQGCLDGGATEIIVADKHAGGKNFIWHELHESARYVIGSTANTSDGRFPELKGSDGLILLGYHAMAGTPAAVLEHTWSSRSWQNFWVNGKLSGELTMDAGLAADVGVPTILVTGDDKVCQQAEMVIPGILKAQVKKSLSLNGAILLSHGAAHRLVREKSAEAVRRCGEFKPIAIESPVTLRLEVTERNGPFSVIDKPFAKSIDARTVEVTGENFTQAFYRLLHM